jgi:hypothetical protein
MRKHRHWLLAAGVLIGLVGWVGGWRWYQAREADQAADELIAELATETDRIREDLDSVSGPPTRRSAEDFRRERERVLGRVRTTWDRIVQLQARVAELDGLTSGSKGEELAAAYSDFESCAHRAIATYHQRQFLLDMETESEGLPPKP